VDLVPKLLELSYDMMVTVYMKHREGADPEIDKSYKLSKQA